MIAKGGLVGIVEVSLDLSIPIVWRQCPPYNFHSIRVQNEPCWGINGKMNGWIGIAIAD
ncbi:MAG: hypothetical protein ACOC3E_02265 [Cyanobacteriota bacterium]